MLRCRKSARRCGAKHISKSTCTKHTILGPHLEVEMLKKCTPLWREAHVQVQMYKTPQLRSTSRISIYLSISLSLSLSLSLTTSRTRLPQFLNLSTSKTKEFCETPSFFEVDKMKNETILRDFLQECKVECRADGLVPMHFVIFPFHLSIVLRLPRKSEASSYEVHLSRKIIFPKLKI